MFVQPRRRIHDFSDMEQWEKSQAKAEFLSFIEQLSSSVKGKQVPQEAKLPNNISKIISILEHVGNLLGEFPPDLDSSQRYGNKKFREWFDKMENDSTALLGDLLDSQAKDGIVEVKEYFLNSFGNRTRIDYGSGHEMFFIIFLLCLCKLNVIIPADADLLVLIVFNKYLSLVRKVQAYYRLEPAGSHGVWGLDDYQFLVYYFGSSQFIGTNIPPKSSINKSFISANHKKYIYLEAIDYINQTKSGPFFEHSRQLYDISGVPTWEKVNSGLLKMYKAEVLVKFPIIQHTLFGSLFSFEPAKK